ncbi:type VI secretion system protein ImpH [Rhizobium paknamense]|uniref:Type VI secretion system protein ImpH n=2 Tax=Rhizobium paknamense TaxID=1206817 RepID=A0ABU0I8L9_9HYPH|nr:type VI secretion system protein ImpH [Rhizobium paknamense]
MKTDQDPISALLERDPGAFEPTTAFRVAQHLSGGRELEIAPHLGIAPTPLAVSGFRRKLQSNRLKTVFAALVGPLGALPPQYNDLLLKQERSRARAFSSFLALFSARFAELFVAANEKYRLARRLRWSPREATGFRTAILSLAGFGTAQLVEKAGVPEDVLLRFAGFFADRTRNGANLAAMLQSFTGLAVQIEQFRPRWVSIPPEELSQLGARNAPRLGVSAMAGSAVQDLAGGLRIVLGPVTYQDYLSLSPGSRRLREIFALSRAFLGNGYDIDVQVVLARDHIPFCQLGAPDMPARLGWNSWARSAPAQEDSRDAIVTEAQGLRASPLEVTA